MKSWKNRCAEEQAALICLGALNALILFAIPQAVYFSDSRIVATIMCLIGLAFAFGCFKMCASYAKYFPKRAGRNAVWAVVGVFGCFGFVGLLALETIAKSVAFRYFNAELPDLTIWYAIPCLIAFIGGLAVYSIKEKKEQKESEKLFQRGK